MPAQLRLIQRLSLVDEHRQEKGKASCQEQHATKEAGDIAEAHAGDDETDRGENEQDPAKNLSAA